MDNPTHFCTSSWLSCYCHRCTTVVSRRLPSILRMEMKARSNNSADKSHSWRGGTLYRYELGLCPKPQGWSANLNLAMYLLATCTSSAVPGSLLRTMAGGLGGGEGLLTTSVSRSEGWEPSEIMCVKQSFPILSHIEAHTESDGK